jgi:polyprenyl-phospho-N-acetylgalactosaminyl synthase
MSNITDTLLPAEVWIVVPAYNEGKRLGATLAQLCERWPNVVVVDDGSRDDTIREADRFPVWLLHHVVNRGQGAALQTGVDFALARGAEVLVTFDSDGQHDAAEIEHLVTPIRNGEADIALGSRFLGGAVGIPLARRLVLRLGVWFTRLFSGIRVSDTHNGLRALSRRAAEQLHLSHDRMAHASEILDRVHQFDWRYVEVPVTVRYSEETLAKGQSSWNAVRIVGQLLLGRLIR